jgi:hypothetical protein
MKPTWLVGFVKELANNQWLIFNPYRFLDLLRRRVIDQNRFFDFPKNHNTIS